MKSNEEEFREQVIAALKRDLTELKTNPNLTKLKQLYIDNFDDIRDMINKYGSKSAIEDIMKIDPVLRSDVLNNRQLLAQINKGIDNGWLIKSSF